MSSQHPGLEEAPIAVDVAPAEKPGVPLGTLGRTFSSLRHRNYRLLWVGTLVYFFALNMQAVVRGWLVYDLTDSALALGWVWAAMGLPIVVFSLVGGVAADRFDRRNLIFVSQATLAVVSVVLGVLIFTDRIAVWHLMVGAGVMGLVFAFIYPGRQALLVELVDEETLMNAIALQNGSIYLAAVGAPALAGLLGGIIGVDGVYFVSVGCYALSMATLLLIPSPGVRGVDEDRSPARDMVAGVRYIWVNRVVLLLLLFGLLPMMFATAVQVLLPALAAEAFDIGLGGLGSLYAALGVGGLAGSAMVAFLGDFRHKGALMIGGSLAYGVVLGLFANSSLPWAFLLLALAAVCSSAYYSVNATLVQMNISDEYRGRVMSVLMLSWGMTPLATLAASAIAEAIGVRMAMTLSAMAIVLFVLVMAALSPRLRRL